jgi:hypothetical protein
MANSVIEGRELAAQDGKLPVETEENKADDSEEILKEILAEGEADLDDEEEEA